MADRIVGISNHTLDTFLAGRSRLPGRDVVHYYAVDASQFKSTDTDRTAFRRELGLADDCRIVLFAGRMVPEKNPIFAVDVFAELHRLDPTVAAVFAGSGSLDDAVCERAEELGVKTEFRYLGWRDDIAAIMCCCDIFILARPDHPMEGFGLAVIEAQLAGLRLLLSQGVADDALLPTAVYRRLPSSAGVKNWARAGLEVLEQEVPTRLATLSAFEKSPFEMHFALHCLQELHSANDTVFLEK